MSFINSFTSYTVTRDVSASGKREREKRGEEEVKWNHVTSTLTMHSHLMHTFHASWSLFLPPQSSSPVSPDEHSSDHRMWARKRERERKVISPGPMVTRVRWTHFLWSSSLYFVLCMCKQIVLFAGVMCDRCQCKETSGKERQRKMRKEAGQSIESIECRV